MTYQIHTSSLLGDILTLFTKHFKTCSYIWNNHWYKYKIGREHPLQQLQAETVGRSTASLVCWAESVKNEFKSSGATVIELLTLFKPPSFLMSCQAAAHWLWLLDSAINIALLFILVYLIRALYSRLTARNLFLASGLSSWKLIRVIGIKQPLYQCYQSMVNPPWV